MRCDRWSSPRRLMAFLLLGGYCLLAACGNRDRKAIEGIQVDLKPKRFDQALRRTDTGHIAEGLLQLHRDFPVFLPFYLEKILPFAVQNSSGVTQAQKEAKAIGYLLTNPDYRNLFDSVQRHFPDTRAIDEALTLGFRYVRAYLPEYKTPELVYFVSGLNSWTAVTYRDTASHAFLLGIGLDMFLGPAYPYYASVGVPAYVAEKLRPEYIPTHAFKSVYEELRPFDPQGKQLLDMMIERGKEWYFLRKVMPDAPDSLVMSYSQAQVDWCAAHEADIYNQFVRQQLLYESNWQKVLRYVNDGPYTSEFGPESPGNLGCWLGYRIVSAYMDRHPKISLQALMSENDAQKILSNAKYKPR